MNLGWVLTMHSYVTPIVRFETRREIIKRPSSEFGRVFIEKPRALALSLLQVLREGIEKVVVVEARYETAIYIATGEDVVVIIIPKDSDLVEVYTQ